MPALPTEPLTRIAELETRLASVEAGLRNTRRRGAESVTARESWPAVTAELASPYYGEPAYPRWDSDQADQLPVTFLDGRLDGNDVLAWLPRSPDPRVVAFSPVGWLPPDTRVEVAWDGRRFRICQAPAILHGLAGSGVEAAEWTGCTSLDLGHGIIEVFRKDTVGVLIQQRYADGSAVQMEVFNTSEMVGAYKLLTVGRDRDNHWTVLVEPCDLECEGAYYS